MIETESAREPIRAGIRKGSQGMSATSGLERDNILIRDMADPALTPPWIDCCERYADQQEHC